jgi:succinoglycan biosynthesis transport protein ExoP
MLEETEERNSEPFDWHSYLALIQRRKWLILLPFFAGWLIVWMVSWWLPSIYRSGTLILVEHPTVPQQFVVPNVAGDLQEHLQSITQQILSRTRLLHIINSLNLYVKERQKRTEDEIVERMRKDIEIELVRDSHNELTAFNIYFSSRDPQVAQQVTTELSNLFISENLEARQAQSQSTTKFLESELEEARKSLSEQEAKVREFKDKHVGELPGQLQSNLQILSGLQGQLQNEDEALNRAKQQNVYLESLLGQYRTFQGTAKGGSNAPMVGLPELAQELEKLRAQLTDLSAHYTDRHPDVRKLKEQIARTEKIREQLAKSLKSKAADTSNADSSSPDDLQVQDSAPIMELESQLKGNKIEIVNRQRAIEEIKSKIGEYQARLNRSPVMEQELADLTRGYDQSKANYDSLLKKKNDSELATSLELRQQGEHFRVLDPPSLPVKPYSPKRLLLCAVGLVVGLVLSGAITAGAELLDDRIYDEKTLKKLIQIPVLSEIPNVSTDSETRAERRDGWLIWATASLMLVSILAGSAVSYFRG